MFTSLCFLQTKHPIPKKGILLFLWLCCSSWFANAQRTMRLTNIDFPVTEALQYIDKGQYKHASNLLHNYPPMPLTTLHTSPYTMQASWALYAKYLCELFLEEQNAIQHMRDFIRNIPFENIRHLASFQMAKYHFKQGKYEQAIQFHNLTNIAYLNNKELNSRNFELGYAYLVTQQMDKVETFFNTAKNIPGQYATQSTYYHGVINYYKKDYSAALQSFEAVKDEEKYKQIIPFYLTELQYLQGNKEKALQDATLHLQSRDRIYYDREMNQLIAQIYLENQEFAKADEFLRKANENQSIDRETNFKRAFIAYQQANLKDAISIFEKIPEDEDALTDRVHYMLATCYLKNAQKKLAIQAFEKYVRSKRTVEHKEISEYSLAKLYFDVGDDTKGLQALQQFVSKFPNASKLEEANELIAYMHLKYARFTDAMIAMQKLKAPSLNSKKVYQLGNFARGLQMLKEDNPEKAIFHFQETKKFPIDASIVALSHFWMSESNYRLGNYAQALYHGDYFLTNFDTTTIPTYTRKLHLLKAYVYVHQNNIPLAIDEYLLAENKTDSSGILASMGSSKPNFIPENIPTLENDPYVFIYDLPEEEIDFVYKPIPLKPLALEPESVVETKNNFVKAGIGNLAGVDLAFGYHADDLLDKPLYFDFSTRSNRGNYNKYQRNSTTHFGASTRFSQYNHRIDAAIALDRNAQYYYGYDMSTYNYENIQLKQLYQNVGITLNVVPLHSNAANIQYESKGYLGVYHDRRGNVESNLRIDLPVSKRWSDKIILQSDFVVDLNAYSNVNSSTNIRRTQRNSMLIWKPSISTSFDKLQIRAGVSPAIANKAYFLPDVLLQYPIQEDKMIAELHGKSQLQLNTFKQLSSTNPFMFTDYTVHPSKSTEVTGGLYGNPSPNISYTIRVGGGVMSNMPFFLKDNVGDGKQFTVLFDQRASYFILHGEFSYVLHKELLAGARWQFKPILQLNSFDEAWQYSPSLFTVFGKMRLTKEILCQTEFFLQGGYTTLEKSKTLNMPFRRTVFSGADLNLSLSYQVNRQWHVYSNMQNILGSKYQRWYGYPMFGTNIIVGVVHSFKPFHFIK